MHSQIEMSCVLTWILSGARDQLCRVVWVMAGIQHGFTSESLSLITELCHFCCCVLESMRTLCVVDMRLC